MKRMVPALVFWVLGAPCLADTSTEATAERMLEALGGRAAWASLTTLVNDSWQYRTEPPHAVRTTIHLDVTRPRFRIESYATDLHVIRAVEGGRGWRLNRAGSIEPVPEVTLAADLRWYAGHVYRTIHRIAARDPALKLAIGADDRLEVHEGGSRIAWYRLDSRGEPYAFGGFEDDEGSLSGPWSHVHAGIRHPVWVARRDGTLRSALVSLETPEGFDEDWLREPDRVVSLEALGGRWEGDGRFGSLEARLELRWEPTLEGRFWRLNATYRGSDGTALFGGEALYSVTAAGVVAQWFDSAGRRYHVTGKFDDACLRVEWGPGGSPAVGRSYYCLEATGRMTVQDQRASASGRWEPLGRFDLERVP